MPDGSWQRDGRPWTMRMVIVCCKGYPDDDPRDLAKSQNWPLTSKEFLQWITFHRQNATILRMFMEPIDERGALFSPYRIATEDLKVDLEGWNPEFWAYVDDIIADGDRRGVVFMVDVFDTWPQDHGLSPWCRRYNVNNVDVCGSNVLRGPPPPRALDFARKVFEETGRHRNVIYQDGNEAFEAMSPEWSLGFRDLLRRVEAERGYVRHPFGTQSDDDGVRGQVDFVSYEQELAPDRWCGGSPRVCKPTMVNESAPLTPQQVLRQVYAADAKGTTFAFWMGEQNQDQRGFTLEHGLQPWAEGQPMPAWARPAERCPSTAGIDVKIHQYVCNNQTVPVPCSGGNAVLDATPLFGRLGPRGVCNSEHDNCDGRICEPPDGLTWSWSAPPGVTIRIQNTGECDGLCRNIPCRGDRGYQLVFENLRPGNYWAKAEINGQTDCEGKRLTNASGQREFWVE